MESFYIYNKVTPKEFHEKVFFLINRGFATATLLRATEGSASLAIGSDLFRHGVATDSSGKPLRMTQAQGIAYCSSAGLRLPNDRDFAAFAASHGALLRNTALIGHSANEDVVKTEIGKMLTDGFLAVYGINDALGLFVDFYINPSKFVKPDEMPNLDRFMSATKNAQWEATKNPMLKQNPVPDVFSTSGHIAPSIYRFRYVTCTGIQ